MNEIKIFESEQFGAVRTMVNNNDGQVWFVGKDVAEALGYAKPTQAIRIHIQDEDVKVLTFKAFPETGKASNLWQGQDYSDKLLINESGLYSLILSSKLESAQQFKHWVTSEVLPQIRQTGGYIPVNAQDDDEAILAKALLIMQRTLDQKDKLISQQDKLLEEQKPAVQFANAVSSCPDSILVRDLAKLITQNGVKIGQGRLFYWLRLHGYLFKNETRPIQKWVEQGLFDTNITLVETNHGTKERCTTKVTGRGQRYFVEGFVSGRFKAGNQDLN